MKSYDQGVSKIILTFLMTTYLTTVYATCFHLTQFPAQSHINNRCHRYFKSQQQYSIQYNIYDYGCSNQSLDQSKIFPKPKLTHLYWLFCLTNKDVRLSIRARLIYQMDADLVFHRYISYTRYTDIILCTFDPFLFLPFFFFYSQ